MFLIGSSRAACVALSAALVSCATSVETVPATFLAAAGAELSLSRSVEVKLPTQYSRVLPAGSSWRKVGTVPQGDVYQAVGTVFTIEGRNVHEAYLIVTPSRSLVGFYLPGESSISTLPSPVQLPIKETP